MTSSTRAFRPKVHWASAMLLVIVAGWEPAQGQLPVAPTQEMQRQNFAGRYTWPHRSSGVLAGEFTTNNVESSSGSYFDFGYTKTIDLGFYSHTYGARIKWTFRTNGPIAYSYTVPYRVNFEFPRFVHSGQVIYLTPTLVWGDPSHSGPISISGAQRNYRYSHTTSVWVDAPDGLDATSTDFTQRADFATVGVKIPVLPGLSAISGSFDCRIWPCTEGGGNYGGSYTKLGGTGTLTTGGTLPTYAYNADSTKISLYSRAESGPAWKQGHEHFELTATVLNLIPTPVTEGAAVALRLAKKLGKLRLNTFLDGRIKRTDFVHIQLVSLTPITVPNVQLGSAWNFDVPVQLTYRIQFASAFYYPMGYDVTFDMVGIDQQTLLHASVIEIPAGIVESGWLQRSGVFRVQGSVPVEAAPAPPGVSAATAAAPYRNLAAVQRTSRPPLPRGARVARKTDTQRLLRVAERRAPPTPTMPGTGQYTVVYGRYPEAQARRIVDDLKRRRIGALMLPVRGSTDKVVSLGSFAKEADALVYSGMLKEGMKINSVVSTNPFEYRAGTSGPRPAFRRLP